MTDSLKKMDSLISNLRSHRVRYDSFRRTPNGLIFTEDLKTVYSVFLICMDLKSNEHESKKLFSGLFSKSYPFTFTMKSAISIMSNLEIKDSSNTTCIHVSYSIKDALARYLLVIFMEAKLLQTPADRTRNEPKEKILLQPTPKGIAILTKYCKDIGLKRIPHILVSNLNSMTLFTFERSSITDSLIHSDKLLHILLINLMGESPNVWKPNMDDDKLPTLSELLENNNDIFTFENANDYFNNNFPSIWTDKPGDKDCIDDKTSESNNTATTITPNEDKAIWLEQIPESKLLDTNRRSPLAHKYFTNPDSDSHVQYYASNTGLRLFYNKQFIDPTITVKYCFTSKVLWQWIMDCTDIIYPKEAITLSALLLKIGLMCPILAKPSKSKTGKFCISRSAFFTLSSFGWGLINWNHIDKDQMKREVIKNKVDEERGHDYDDVIRVNGKIVEIDINSTNSNKTMVSSNDDQNNTTMNLPNLEEILSDPGMRYLFKKHLEKEFCVENLDVYIMIKKFLKRMTILKKFIDNTNDKNSSTLQNYSVRNQSVRSTIDSALLQQANECLEMAFQIYSCYIMVGAPYQLNLDHNLREDISDVILNPKSPIKEYFHERESTKIPNALSKIELIAPSTIEIRNPPVTMTQGLTRLNKPKMLSSLNNINDDTIGYKKILETLRILKQLYSLFEDVGIIMYKLMEIDSLSKFYNSKEFEEIK
ncbi:protein Sst2p [Monosporozyma servazzii]